VTGGVLLGIDVGRARIGVAGCDAGRLLAFPIETVHRDAGDGWRGRIVQLAEEYRAVAVVCGLPINLRGEHTPSTDDAIAVGQIIAARTGLPVRMLDERLTTNVAARQLRPSGRRRGRQRQVIDQQAAVAILQQALEIAGRTGELPGEPVAPAVEGGMATAPHSQEEQA
jgi:putative Holliday junction resolvase